MTGRATKNKVLLIGWDAADWEVINPLVDTGLMPAMEQLINNGVMGNLSTLEPPLSPMLWTSIATGKLADQHGVLGFTEPLPDGSGVRPVSVLSRKVKAVWNILMQEGKTVHTVGWWPSHPAEPLNGSSVSDLYQKAPKKNGDEWKMAPDTVYPEELDSIMEWLRLRPEEMSQEHLLPFVPKAAEVEQEKDKRLFSLAKILAENSSLHNAATWILDNRDWDFLGLYLDGIDHFCHGFMNYHPPRLKWVKEKDYDLYKEVVKSAYRYHDMMLERLIQLAGPETTVILVSDHGFQSGRMRPQSYRDEPAGPAYQHRELGVVCMMGPGIKKDERIYGASLLNIAPTILSIFGLPIGQDMAGAPLVDAFIDPPELETIPSWEEVEGDCGMLPPETEQDPAEAAEALRQLVELGYIEDPGPNAKVAIERSQRELDYNLARVYISSNRFGQALPLLEKLYENQPDESRFMLRYSEYFKRKGDSKKAREICETYLKKNKGALTEIKKKFKELKEKDPEEFPKPDVEKLKEKGISEENIIKPEMVKKKMLGEVNKNLAKRRREVLRAEHRLGELLLSEGKHKEAKEVFDKMPDNFINRAGRQHIMANAYKEQKKWGEAHRCYANALRINQEDAQAMSGLAICEYHLGQHEQSAEMALDSIGILYHQPLTHYYLGLSLIKLEEYGHAANAFEVCLSQMPGLAKAREELIELYKTKLNMAGKAQAHIDFMRGASADRKLERAEVKRQFSKDGTAVAPKAQKHKLTIEDSIIIVSGLPRSGTSLAMQMLTAGGLQAYTDRQREADDNNPRGYYEHEKVKNLARDKSWLKEAKGKALKVVSHQLLHLPHSLNYKIVFMRRDMDEILQSQHKMLERLNKKKAYHAGLAENFRKNLKAAEKWIDARYNAEAVYIDYSEAIARPADAAAKINAFLEGRLDESAMAESVDPELYRNKLQ